MSGLNVGDQVLLLLLQRVHDGAITERFGFYFDDGEQICYWVNHVGRCGRVVTADSVGTMTSG